MKIYLKNGILLKMLMIIISASIIITVSGCFAIPATETPLPINNPPRHQTETTPTITVGGVVESAQRRNVYATAGFIIDDVAVEIGDRVTEGQVLATLDTEDLVLSIAQANAQLELARLNSELAIEESRRVLNQASGNINNNVNIHVVSAQAAVAAADANITALQQSLEDAQSDRDGGSNAQIIAAQAAIRNAQIAVDNSQSDYDDALLLYEIGAISQIELRRAEDALSMAKNAHSDAEDALETIITALDRGIEQIQTSMDSAIVAREQAQSSLNAVRNAARQEVDMLRSNIELAELSANLEAQEIAIQILERNLEQSQITAPIGGTITQVIAEEGMIGSGLLFTIEDTEDLRIIARFREYDIGLVSEGTEVKITADMIGSDTYMGVITRINPAAVSTIGMPGGIVEFEAEVTVTSPETKLRIGMNVRVSLM